MTQAFSSTGAPLDREAFVPATLRSVRQCPARADYIELRFDTAQGPWDWCFPEPPSREPAEPVGPLALTLGRYDARAYLVTDGVLGPVVPSDRALAMILGGAEVSIARQLVAAGR